MMELTPWACVISVPMVACTSVGNPGKGMHWMAVALSIGLPMTRTERLVSCNVTPMAASLTRTGCKWSGRTLSSSMSPPVMAAATAMVLPTIRSGMARATVP